MRQDNDFFDNISDDVLSQIEEEQETENLTNVEFKYLISIKKSASDETPYFTEKDVKYLQSLFSSSLCFKNFSIVDVFKKPIDKEFFRYNELTYERWYLGILFNFEDNLNVLTLRRFLMNLFKQNLEDIQCGYLDNNDKDALSFISNSVIYKDPNDYFPETSIFGVFYIYGFADDYLKKFGLDKIIKEQHLMMHIRNLNVDSSADYSLSDVYNSNLGNMEFFCLVPLLNKMSRISLSFEQLGTGTISHDNNYCLYPSIEEPENDTYQYLNFNKRTELREWRDESQQKQIDDAMTYDSISYKFEQDSCHTYTLCWFKKLIELNFSMSDKNTNVPYLIVKATRQPHKTYNKKNYDFFIRFFGNEKDISKPYSQASYRFIMNLFDKYEDCFTKKDVHFSHNRNPKKANHFTVFGCYSLRAEVNPERFRNFLNEVLGFSKYKILRNLSVQFFRKSDSLHLKISNELSLTGSRSILYSLFWLHKIDDKFVSQFGIKQLIKETIENFHRNKKSLLLDLNNRFYLSLFHIKESEIEPNPRFDYFDNDSDNARNVCFKGNFSHQRWIIEDSEELRKIAENKSYKLTVENFRNIKSDWKWYLKIINLYDGNFDIPYLIVDTQTVRD